MASIGFASLQVIPSMRGISGEVTKGLSGLDKIGRAAGQKMGQSLASGIADSKAAVEKASAALAKARAAEQDAAGKVRVAEAKLQALREKGVTDAGRLAAAEENLASAKRKSELATSAAARADGTLASAKKQLASASEDAGAKTGKLGGAFDGLKAKASKLAPALDKVGKAAAAGIAAVATIALKKGFDRLNALDQAEAKLRGLGRTSQDIESILGSVNKSVKGTAFSLAEAADSAATFSTVGVKSGADMDRAMKLLADTTAQAGSSFGEMTPIFSKIIAQGGLTTETFDQLNERATGVGEALSKHLGIPMDQVRDKAKDIDFATFAAAMEKNIGGAAQKTGDTFQGAWDNVMASLGRIGATVLQPLFEVLPPIFEKIMDAIDSVTKKLAPFSGYIKPIAVAVGVVAAGILAVAAATKVWAIATGILNTVLAMNPITLIVIAIAALVAGLVYAYKNSETFRNIVQAAWNGIKVAVSATWNWIQTTLWPGLKAVFTGIGTVVMWLWNNVIKPAWAGIKIAIEVAWNIIKGYFTVWMTVIRAVGAVVMWLWNNVMKPAWNGIKILLAVVWAGIKAAIDVGMAVFRAVGAVVMWLWRNVMVPAWRGIQLAIQIARDVISGVIDTIKGIFQSVADKAEEVKNWLTEKWNAVVSFFQSIPGKISSAAKGMWDGIKDAFKGVINWIIRAWNSLEFTIPSVEIFGKKIGGATLSVPKLQELAQGGQVAGRRRDGLLWGPGTGTSDSILGVDALGAPTALVSAGEFVVNEAATKRWLPLLAAINGGARSLQRLATGGVVKREPYGLPNGTNTGGYGSGGNIFPEWVRKLGQEFSVKPSTYPGHQEGDRNEPGYAPNPQRLNRGIDWVGTIDAMHKFALHLLGIAPKSSGLEQIIWQNPQSGQKVGWAGRTPDTSGSYFAGDYGGHQDHVHIRASEDFTAVAPAEPDPAAVTPADPADPVTPETPTPTPSTPAPAQEQKPTIGTTLSGIAGKAVEGQVQSLLGVLGIGDSPPVLGAIDEAQRQQNEQQSPTDPDAVTPADPATPTAPETPKPGRLPGWEGYAFDITEQAKKMNLVKRAAIIGNATALVEAGDPLKMWANRAVPESLKFPHDAVGSDHDSIGLFQQRDNGAWGTVADRMDPHKSAKMFYDALVKIPNWESMDMGAAAQAVQRSALPGKYAQKIGRATELVDKAKLYDSGGWLPKGLTMTNNQTGDVEPILTRSQWADAHDAIAIVKRQIAEQSAPGEPVPQVIYNIQTARVEDAFLEARKKEEQRMTAKMAGL
ncbi:phage tail protein [Gordonia iterans]